MDKYKRTTRLSYNDGYKRPKKTVQDLTTQEEIDEKLEDYIPVDNIENVPRGTHIRYFKIEQTPDGGTKKKFCYGGFLKNKDNHKKYIVLTNNDKNWCAQVDKCIFFKKISINELKEEHKIEVDELKYKIKKYKKENKYLRKKLHDLGY